MLGSNRNFSKPSTQQIVYLLGEFSKQFQDILGNAKNVKGIDEAIWEGKDSGLPNPGVEKPKALDKVVYLTTCTKELLQQSNKELESEKGVSGLKSFALNVKDAASEPTQDSNKNLVYNSNSIGYLLDRIGYPAEIIADVLKKVRRAAIAIFDLSSQSLKEAKVGSLKSIAQASFKGIGGQALGAVATIAGSVLGPVGNIAAQAFLSWQDEYRGRKFDARGGTSTSGTFGRNLGGLGSSSSSQPSSTVSSGMADGGVGAFGTQGFSTGGGMTDFTPFFNSAWAKDVHRYLKQIKVALVGDSAEDSEKSMGVVKDGALDLGAVGGKIGEFFKKGGLGPKGSGVIEAGVEGAVTGVVLKKTLGKVAANAAVGAAGAAGGAGLLAVLTPFLPWILGAIAIGGLAVGGMALWNEHKKAKATESLIKQNNGDLPNTDVAQASLLNSNIKELNTRLQESSNSTRTQSTSYGARGMPKKVDDPVLDFINMGLMGNI